MDNTVFLKAIESYDEERLLVSITEMMTACGVEAMIAGKENILVKPNLLMRADPAEAVATHPAVLRAVLLALKSFGAKKLLVYDSPGGPYTPSMLRSVYKGCGLLALEDIEGVTLNLDTVSREIELDGRCLKRLTLSAPVLEADCIVTVGRLKTHALAGMTAAVKNLFGCIPGLLKAELHTRFPDKREFCDMLVDIAEYIRPQLSIVDGIVGMEGDGPSGGTPREFGVFGMSQNPHHLDRALAHYLGMGVGEALTVGASVNRGLAPENVGDVAVAGDADLLKKPIDDLVRPRSTTNTFPGGVPKFLEKPATWILGALPAHPVILRKKCIGCGKCKEICPRQTIRIIGGCAAIEKKSCIRCFCCHEICPERAIDIGKGARWGR